MSFSHLHVLFAQFIFLPFDPMCASPEPLPRSTCQNVSPVFVIGFMS
ncbi:hypothetical protein Ptr902_04750 [Pyrenophora tritici-repentis]|nr:hypothetical protein PtrV1_06674 [Pyrenophora tritici-repentis]KAI0585324.1 hypothetical protein Alg215_02555 [Pyrenophora tritici-repentis]KAI2485810.1 hypothetical protein Ptr902_04750 [Pyrenophora tritici-repentis]